MHMLNEEELFKTLDTSKRGLSSDKVNLLLKENGLNTLPKAKRDSIFKIFLNQVKNPMVFILILTAIISLLIHEYTDALFIFLVILLDASLGTFEEYKAEKSAADLQELIDMNVIVMRDGIKKEINSKELVVGDLVMIESGHKIGADMVIIEASNLTIDEAFLTGESIASVKSSKISENTNSLADRINVAYSGSVVLTGKGKGIVIATGTDTEIGKIADKVILKKGEKTPIIIRMEKFTKQISIIIGVLSILLAVILYIKGYILKEIFFVVVALSVSAIPEGLPVSLTITLSIATNRMAKKNVIVRKLNSVESLGSCTVIASDKTGTLTLNEQTVKAIYLPNGTKYDVTGSGYNGIGEVLPNDNNEIINRIGKSIYINNDAFLNIVDSNWKHHGDAMDVACLALSYKLKIDTDSLEVIKEFPYESENKYSETNYKDNNKIYHTIKGAVEVITEKSKYMYDGNKKVSIDIDKINKMNDEIAGLGYRLLAVSSMEDGDNGYTFLGLLSFLDPIRDDAKESLDRCLKAGIKVVIITGDHPLTAYNIGKELNIISNKDELVTGEELSKLTDNQEEFDALVNKTRIFARVNPIEKLAIIESYKRLGEFIAVTGDGVNDAPAIRSANLGIAMGSGTDVAKETSSMIIKDDSFTSIVAGVEEGRYAYNNIRKVIYMLISGAVAEILFFVLAIIFNLPIPLLAIQLLWLNLVTDGIQDVALASEKGEAGVMDKKPRSPKELIFNKELIHETLLAGTTIGLIIFALWYYLIKNNFEIVHARTYILMAMVFMQNIHTFNCRSESQSTFKIPLKNNYFVVIGIVITFLLHLIVTQVPFLSPILNTVPLTINEMLLTFSIAIPLLIVIEIYKWLKRKGVFKYE